MARVLLLEDQKVVRDGVSRLLRQDPGFSLVAVLGSLEQLGGALDSGVEFELAVVDLHLPDGSGLTALHELRRRRPTATAVVFTVFDDDDRVFEALRAGARGYVLKNTPPRRLLELFTEAVNGGAPLTPSVARRVVQRFSQGRDEPSPLTARELDVLQLLVDGNTYAATAERLGVSLNTVQTHVRSIYEKLEVSSKAEATRVAVRRGIVAP